VDADVNAAAAIEESKLSLASDAAADVPSRRTLGTGATQAAAGDDSRLSDERVPTDGSVTASKLVSGLADDLGVSVQGTARRGYQEELGMRSLNGNITVAHVNNINLPQAGLIFVAFTALWWVDAGYNLDAYLKLNGSYVKIWQSNDSTPAYVQAQLTNDTQGKINSLTTTAFGLSTTAGSGTNMGAEVTTGMVVGHTYDNEGGPCCIWANAGSKSVSIETGGVGNIKSRRLWVWTMGV
jgi:hypothetical protein